MIYKNSPFYNKLGELLTTEQVLLIVDPLFKVGLTLTERNKSDDYNDAIIVDYAYNQLVEDEEHLVEKFDLHTLLTSWEEWRKDNNNVLDLSVTGELFERTNSLITMNPDPTLGTQTFMLYQAVYLASLGYSMSKKISDNDTSWVFTKADDEKEYTLNGISDKYHSMGQLYEQRLVLSVLVFNMFSDKAWKSKFEYGGEKIFNSDTSFIVGIDTPLGQYTYHYDMEHWDKFKVKELPESPEWDGHTADDITRLYSL